LSYTRTSFRASFRSEKDLLSRAGVDTTEPIRPKPVSLKRLYSMLGPDWIYGVVGTISAFVAGALLPLFALGMAQSLVAYYMDWHTTCQEIRKISILFCCGAVISIFAYAIMHLCFGIMGERLAFRVREIMFSGKYAFFFTLLLYYKAFPLHNFCFRCIFLTYPFGEFIRPFLGFKMLLVYMYSSFF
jgi:ATP-binding cassette subfamily B (MDR/TAP) protein 1